MSFSLTGILNRYECLQLPTPGLLLKTELFVKLYQTQCETPWTTRALFVDALTLYN